MKSLNKNGLSSLLVSKSTQVIFQLSIFTLLSLWWTKGYMQTPSLRYMHVCFLIFLFFFLALTCVFMFCLWLVTYHIPSCSFHFDLRGWTPPYWLFCVWLMAEVSALEPPFSVVCKIYLETTATHWEQTFCLFDFVFRTSYDFIPKFSTSRAGNIRCCFFIVW